MPILRGRSPSTGMRARIVARACIAISYTGTLYRPRLRVSGFIVPSIDSVSGKNVHCPARSRSTLRTPCGPASSSSTCST
jgi:hypothetical protein